MTKAANLAASANATAGNVTATALQSNAANTPTLFKDSAGTQIGTLCRAWVNFDGTTSPGTIRASFNVTSVTKNGTGDYTINFTNAMPDANYAAGSLCSYDNANNPYRYATAYSWSASALRVNTFYNDTGSTKYDSGYVTVSVFR